MNSSFLKREIIGVRRVAAQAAAVDAVGRDVERLQAGCLHDRLDDGQAVVLQVFVADGVVRVHRQHHRHVTHLEDPQSLRRENLRNAFAERDRVFQIVKHRDRGDRVELFASQPLEEFGRWKDILHDRRAGHLLRHVAGIDAVFLVRIRVAVQERAVVATDIEHARRAVRLVADESGGLRGDAAQVVAHRLVGARAVPVRRIQDFRRDGVLHLQQSAGVFVARGIATHQGAGDATGRRHFLAGFDEGALQVLLAQIDDLGQSSGTTNPARRAVDQMHKGKGGTASDQCEVTAGVAACASTPASKLPVDLVDAAGPLQVEDG